MMPLRHFLILKYTAPKNISDLVKIHIGTHLAQQCFQNSIMQTAIYGVYIQLNTVVHMSGQ